MHEHLINFVERLPCTTDTFFLIIWEIFSAFLMAFIAVITLLIIGSIIVRFLRFLVFLWKRAVYIFRKVKWV